MTFKEWKYKAKSFDYKNNKIAYWEEGEGPVLLLIHGFPTASWDWHKLWNDLTQKFRVIAPDMIGFGYSAKPKKYNYSITDQARLHEALIDYLGITEAHLLVHDYGVSVAQEMLAAFSERGSKGFQILSCCFLNGGLFPELHRAKLVQKLLNSPIGAIFNRFLSKKSLRNSFHDIYGEKKASEEEIDYFYQLIIHKDGKNIMHKLIGYINDRKANAKRWKTAIVQASIPIKIINGPLDPISGRHLADYCKKILPSPNITILEGVGHYPHDEAPDQVREAFYDFLSIK
jgi:pimeloyl-ACP methyl ester carboxylesterase